MDSPDDLSLLNETGMNADSCHIFFLGIDCLGCHRVRQFASTVRPPSTVRPFVQDRVTRYLDVASDLCRVFVSGRQ